MNHKILSRAALAVGLAALAWVAYGYAGTSPLALTMTALIASFYALGALELHRFQQATASLRAALVALPGTLSAPAALADWLARLPTPLQNPVRLRIESERSGLPGPVMTPYLVGLLVLLGMLGTFLGMVVTLNGAVMALETTTDLPTIRAALAAPVKGLGLAFGTSVAGVAASAMLGLASALCRRERLQAAQALDGHIATTLRPFSRAHQRQQSLQALQQQAQAVPDLLGQVQALMAQMAQQHNGLNQRLLDGQTHFHGHAQAAYAELAVSVDRSLQRSLVDSTRAASTTLQPVVEATMAGIARESAAFQARVADTVAQQVAGLAHQFAATVNQVGDGWAAHRAQQAQQQQVLANTQQAAQAVWAEAFDQRAAALLATVAQGHAAHQAASATQDQQRLAAWHGALETLSATLQREWHQAAEHATAQQAQICQTLAQTAQALHTQAENQARHTATELSQLMATAAEAPRAAAAMVGGLRQQLADSLARDNQLLAERQSILAALGQLLDEVNQGSTAQRAAIEGLVGSAATLLQQAGAQFGQRLDAESARLAEASTQLAGSAVEVASLGEAFGMAVQQFSDASQSLAAQLQRIEAALGQSTARSDEQLAYYVAQARELIDLSIASQSQIVEDLQQLAIRQTPLAGEPA